MRLIWFTCGGISLILAIIGIPLPGLPTVPFLLLAAFCFARSSDRVHSWLINHPKLGPSITDWQRSGAIRRPAKIAASCAIAASLALSILMGIPTKGVIAQAFVLLCVSIFIWTRPNA